MNTEPLALDQAAWELLEAKRLEDEARAKRLACEERVIALVGLKGDEGTQTAKTSFFKVTTSASLSRALKPDWQDLTAHLPRNVIEDCVRTKYEVSVSGLKRIATTVSSWYQDFLQAMVTKPSKPAVKVELLAREEVA